MQVVIIEDERPNSTRLKKMLAELDTELEVLATLETIADSVAWFRQHPHPDVVLMDVRIADGLSFDIFPQVQLQCPVVFITAYDEYAVRAFKVNSLDYLLKPVEKEDLGVALEKVRSKKMLQDTGELVKQLLGVLQRRQNTYRTRFVIPVRDELKTVLSANIDFIYYSITGTHLVLKDREQLQVNMSMDELEEQLDPDVFFRVNRQHIVHIDSIQVIKQYAVSKLRVVLKQDTEREIIISKEKAPLFRQWLDR
ncbi:LytR/AlgR family response regulator transcription factor [Chitinophaga sancti]|uniref:LytTR family DNA-binding domain-containing protein n=1 Tax=Chitinophaga sancti TaxID=1004 RepID=A0A1K1MU37_9BACT|nr:LytTR family DNA-binding domain-containing protein [Chitinophaga sancti]WQD62996.1 LytTR family DNA-binding domain-containing protein [Chitinophaga sancti]WQG91379.1 LytTR family DNA-binding domain-containing protein [Chitinophaga sancti]SFW26700.1 two component transcriptional regulator, LytTR family [Chitinophaga sancti]